MIILPPEPSKDGILHPPAGGFPKDMAGCSFDGTNWVIYEQADKALVPQPTLTAEEYAVIALGKDKSEAVIIDHPPVEDYKIADPLKITEDPIKDEPV